MQVSMNQTLHGLNRDKFTQVYISTQTKSGGDDRINVHVKATGAAEPLNEKIRLRKPALLHPIRKIELSKPARMAEIQA